MFSRLSSAATRSGVRAFSTKLRPGHKFKTFGRYKAGAFPTFESAHMDTLGASKWEYTRILLVLSWIGYMMSELGQDEDPRILLAGDVDYAAVRNAVADVMDSNLDYDDGSYGPVFVRLAWHAAGTFNKHDGTGGSDGATMRFAPESEHGANAGLDVARAMLEPIKAQFPGLTYADLWSLAGATAIEEMGGPKISWRSGRSDKPDSSHCTPDGRLPDAGLGSDHLREVFYRMGFNDREIVALSGAHALGRCHTDRSGFSGPWTFAPTTFSNQYFQLLLKEKWTPKRWSGPFQYEDSTGDLMMLPTDMALVRDPKFLPVVQEYARDEEAFRRDFASAFTKLQELGVNFGGKGSSCCSSKKSQDAGPANYSVPGRTAAIALLAAIGYGSQ